MPCLSQAPSDESKLASPAQTLSNVGEEAEDTEDAEEGLKARDGLNILAAVQPERARSARMRPLDQPPCARPS